MTPGEEFALYHRNRKAWAEYMAPIWRERAKKLTDAQKRQWWAMAGPELRRELERLKCEAGAS